MTKAKARERAKAKALQKLKKKLASANQPEQETHPGQFDPGNTSISSPSVNANTRSFAGATRGSARSR